MQPSRNKHNRNFAGQTKTEGGGPTTLTLNLGIRHFGEKALELLLQISLAIPWDYVEKNATDIWQVKQRHRAEDS